MTDDDVRAILRAKIKEAGSQFAFATEHGIDRSAIGAFLAGRRKPPPQIIVALGLRRVITYEPVK